MDYREFAAPPSLADAIECIWTMRPGLLDAPHRVVPDGCADILFTKNGRSSTLQAVGAMTRYRDFSLSPEAALLGVRFRPAAWSRQLRIPGDRIRDEILPLEALWGARARRLQERLEDANAPEDAIAILECHLTGSEPPSAAQRAISFLETSRGLCSIADVARQAGLSPRQFRRVCIAETGLTPKFLARVVRLRHAMARMRAHPCTFAHLALDCGYYDQAHLINEFRELSGRTPGGRFFQSA